MAELPYRAEYAKSGRAACKVCKEKIDQDTLRIAVMVQLPFHDWHHEECFFKKQRPTTHTDISNFNNLEHQDQVRLKAAIETNTGIVMPEEAKGKKAIGKKRAADDGAVSNAALKDFLVEYAKSSRAGCKSCKMKTCKTGEEAEEQDLNTVCDEKLEDDIATTVKTSSDTCQLKWHSHSAQLNGSVAALLRSERFTDVVLCTMDGSQIPAHKFILSSCSVYLSSLFDGQSSVMRMGGMQYVVLPSEITTKALEILVEYMYKGETTVSNEVLDTVLKAGEVLKIRGLWRQLDEAGGNSAPAEKIAPGATPASVNKQSIVKKPEGLPKIAIKKDDKVSKFNPVQTQGGVTRPILITPSKLVFIKTSEGGTQASFRPGAPLGTKGQSILLAPAPTTTQANQHVVAIVSAANTTTVPITTISDDSTKDAPPSRFLTKHAVEKKYGKRQKIDGNIEGTKNKDKEEAQNKDNDTTTEIMVKDEPEWDASSIEEEERSIAEMFQQEMSVKCELIDEDSWNTNSMSSTRLPATPAASAHQETQND